MADLDLEDNVIDVIAGIEMDLEYEVPVLFYPGEEAVLNKLPEDCSPGGCDDWEIDKFDSLVVACSIAQPAATSLTAYEFFQLIVYIQADINTNVECELFAERAVDAGNDKNKEEPDCDPRDESGYDENMFSHLKDD